MKDYSREIKNLMLKLLGAKNKRKFLLEILKKYKEKG